MFLCHQIFNYIFCHQMFQLYFFMSPNTQLCFLCHQILNYNFYVTKYWIICSPSETSLSLIAGIRTRPSRMVMALANGGAILDYRTKDGSTAMHRAVAANNIEAVRSVLYWDGSERSQLYIARSCLYFFRSLECLDFLAMFLKCYLSVSSKFR